MKMCNISIREVFPWARSYMQWINIKRGLSCENEAASYLYNILIINLYGSALVVVSL